MNAHDVLRSVRDALDLGDARVLEITGLAGSAPTPEEIQELTGAIPCTDALLGRFLEGLILDLRGPPAPGAPTRAPEPELTNNIIFKKLRVALSLQEAQVLAMLAAGGAPRSKRELTPLFRNPAHTHYRACDDETLGAFLAGLGLAKPA